MFENEEKQATPFPVGVSFAFPHFFPQHLNLFLLCLFVATFHPSIPPPLPPPMTSPHPRASVRAARIASHVAPSSLFPLSPSSLCLRPTNMVVATPVEPAKVKQKKNYLDLENSENAYANNTEHVCCDLNAKEGEGIMKGI